MSLDFQQVHQQVRQMGETALQRESTRSAVRQKARELLAAHADDLQSLCQKVERARLHDATLRCALPVSEPLTAHFPAPPLPEGLTLLAADGSQINPDRHAPVTYCLINVGAIQMRYGSGEPPCPLIESKLLYDEDLYTSSGVITEALVALRRDLYERQALARLAATTNAARPEAPIIAITDGPLELWSARDEGAGREFEDSLKKYQAALHRLYELNAINAGYVDKPGANLLVRLLEIAAATEDELPNIHESHPLRGVTDLELLSDDLPPGERSAVFAIQAKSAYEYRSALALRFFYLNVGSQNAPWLARVEIPAWVADTPSKLDALQAALLDQCRILGGHPYPYLLHRAHETAVVTIEEKEQLTQMIVLELRRRGVPVGQVSHKQAVKDLPGRSPW